MGAPAPKPTNFRAMVNAWDNPVGFARESGWVVELWVRLGGGIVPARDWTNTRERTTT